MNESVTRPPAGMAQTLGIQGQGTIPLAVASFAETASVQSGVATKYWIELLAYPPGSARSLWLFVGNAWKRLDNPSASIQDAVQRAFLGSGSTVRVWFNGEVIVGLVVEGN